MDPERAPSPKLIIDAAAYGRWLGERGNALEPALRLDKPTLRNSVCLALLDREGIPHSYPDIEGLLRERGVLFARKGRAPRLGVESLRLAVSDVSRQLREKNAPFRLKTERLGKEARVSLVREEEIERVEDSFRVLFGNCAPTTEPEACARALVRDGGGLPPAAYFSNYRAAAQWLCYSAGLGISKKVYEAEAFHAYGLGEWTEADGRFGLVGLAVGEGLGEVELIERLLNDRKRPLRQLHYMAVDSSELMLTSHVCLLRERFRHELQRGRLVLCPVLGDIHQLPKQISEARAFVGPGFLHDMPITCTFFGNSLGNEEACEWEFFRDVLGAFPKTTRTAILVGISLLRWKDEDKESGDWCEEEYFLDAFTLETPRSLVHEQKLLISDAKDEFVVPFHEGNITGARIPSEPYETREGVRGRVYRLRYKLKGDLRTWDGEYVAEQGTDLLLFSVIKYDRLSLMKMLQARGLTVLGSERYPILKHSNGPEQYRYEVLAVIRK